MNSSVEIAKHLRAVHFGPNWTAVNLRDKLAEVTWQQATIKIGSFHSIATLVFHINYYISATIEVLKGGPLNAKDEYSFDCPPISSQQDWERLLNKLWEDAEELAELIERLPDERLDEYFMEEKYGTYYRCLQGPIEHAYYHLGQISIIKTLVLGDTETASASS